jgi:CheY-like chemotaxis protein
MTAKTEILLIEDEGDQRETLAWALEDEGYEVLQAADGRAGLAYLQAGRRPAVILLDMHMPGMDGWRFSEELRADPGLAHIPVIAVSAAVTKDPLSPHYADVSAIVAKPLDFDELIAKLHRYDGERRARGRGLPI